MAFGVKWNETGKRKRLRAASAGLQTRGQGATSPRRRPGDALRMGVARRARRLHPPTRPQTGREGEEGEDRPSTIFLTVQNTQTRSGAFKLRRGTEPRAPTRAARTRPARGPGPRAEAPWPDSAYAGREPRTAHPSPLPHFLDPAVGPRKSALSRRCWLLHCWASSLKKQDTRRRQPRLSPRIRPTLGASQAQG